MKKSKAKTQFSVIDLNARIALAVSLAAQIETLDAQLKAEREAIKALMQSADLKRHANDKGDEALLIDKDIYTWNVEKLTEVLDEDEVEEYCPRKAEGAKLRQHYDSDPVFKDRMKKCFKKTTQYPLEVRAAAATGAAAKVDEVAQAREEQAA
jgi:hypothetical protein